jgi:signal transduction histidine kinase
VRGTADAVFTVADSTPDGGLELEDVQRLAQESLNTGRNASGTEPTRIGRRALAAKPLRVRGRLQYVFVMADDLAEVQDTVSLIRRQVLVSGAIALLIAVAAGYAVAGALAARVKRLERAARNVAGGDFSDRVVADHDDELGQLAAAFADMQSQLARLDGARKQFIAQASHELRTPIFSLGGFLELLEDEDLDEETRARFIAQVRGQVERLRKLTTELLDLSRMEAGALVLRPEPTDVAVLAHEVAAEFTPAAAQHGSRLAVRADDPGLEIEADPERVAQVLRILLDNALVHTPPGTDIDVSARRVDGHVRLRVADTGLGIKRQTMPHIFEPFFTDGDAGRGAGLGLAIAHELAEQMQGELAVRSAPGNTAFTLVLPA